MSLKALEIVEEEFEVADQLFYAGLVGDTPVRRSDLFDLEKRIKARIEEECSTRAPAKKRTWLRRLLSGRPQQARHLRRPLPRALPKGLEYVNQRHGERYEESLAAEPSERVKAQESERCYECNAREFGRCMKHTPTPSES